MTKVWTQHVKPWRTKAAEGCCCAFQTVGSELGVNSMKTWIRPASCQMFRMVWGTFSWHTLGHMVPTEPCINTTGYLSAVAGHIHLLYATNHSNDFMFSTLSVCFSFCGAFCNFGVSTSAFISPQHLSACPASLHLFFLLRGLVQYINSPSSAHRSLASLSPDPSRLILSIPVTPSENLSPVRSFQTSNFIVIEPSLRTF